ncbi:sulfatase-like hydrolase/transferase [Nocardioides sp. GXZ039]|uniref:sulfatase-like hydrolase/transferase n=1 Tax=Nocardioides sp. GXZ039 TaxID=3136018 RepID=UPI0030F4B049
MSVRRPNILLVMADEHAPMFSGAYGHHLVQTPNLDQLAEDGVTFDAAYCNSPICAPSRMSLLTGRLPHEIGAFDLASELPADEVTYAHVLRAAGYDAVLAGKQHFVGADQLHGFREQLSFDVHEGEHPLHGWPDDVAEDDYVWQHPLDAGPGTSRIVEADEATETAAIEYLHERAAEGGRPWMLCASFVAPHWPYRAPEPWWGMYDPDDVDVPVFTEEEARKQHPAISRLRERLGVASYDERDVRRARAAYFAMISQLDDRIGNLRRTLVETGQDQDTVVIYTSDHGGMLGEHGLWRKMNFYEHSVRVPLIVAGAGGSQAGSRVARNVSLVDVAATIADLAGTAFPCPIAGTSLRPLLQADEPASVKWDDCVFSEYLAHGVARPVAMLRDGDYKLIHYTGEPSQLFDVRADPGELNDLARSPDHRDVLRRLRRRLLQAWDPDAVEMRVLRSQVQRLVIREANGYQSTGAEPT